MNSYSNIIGRKIKIGIVGCGRISKNHFASIEKHSGDMGLVSVCDVNAAVLRVHAEQYKVPSYREMEEMLQKEQLDLVALCTPSGIHPDQTVLAAKHKVHVITEKPMATRWQDGVRMVKACDEAGVRSLWSSKIAVTPHCTIVCGVSVGEYAFVAAGAVINRDVKPYALMAGVPARQIGWMSSHGWPWASIRQYLC